MKILIIGNGGREHAIAWKIAQSPLVTNIFVAPGNAGTATESKTQNINIPATDIKNLCDFAQKEKIDLTIVGPEAPLALGVVDLFQQHNLKIFGPTQKAAQLESSKTFCKAFLQQHSIPTAKYGEFTEIEKALNYLAQQNYPIVIKADGLAAGKGVVIAQNKSDAVTAIKNMLSDNQFGEAGHKIIIEEFLEGEELSYIVICDGKNILPLASSQDHKRRDDHDQGPNTGGMGAYSPAPILTNELEKIILDKVIQPTITGMQQLGTPYTGFLYAGLLIKNNQPHVLEFNCRLGDPETQPLMMRLNSDLIEICLSSLSQTLNQIKTEWDPRVALAVVLANRNYPDSYTNGQPIYIDMSYNDPHAKLFHAGTAMQNEQLVTAGGRVFAATALADTILQAQSKAYALARQVSWPGCFYRTDIGARAALSLRAQRGNPSFL